MPANLSSGGKLHAQQDSNQVALLDLPHTCSPEGLAGNVNCHIGLLAHSILGTAGQEVADDEVIKRLLL